jgi:FMN phosphatase YigB (HAD superfamily)
VGRRRRPCRGDESEEGNMDIKMIVTDIDDTLLKKDKAVSEYTLNILSLSIQIPQKKQRKFPSEHRSILDIYTPFYKNYS